MLGTVHAQFDSAGNQSVAKPTPVQAEAPSEAPSIKLLAVDANRQAAVFEDAQGRLSTISQGQMLPGSKERLSRVFADSVELSRQSEREPLIVFLKLGENLSEKRAETLEAVNSKNRPVQQIVVENNMPVPEAGGSAARSSIPPPRP